MTLPFRVLVITDEDACRPRGVIETVVRAVADDARGVAVLVRDKKRDVRDLCVALRAVTKRAGALLLVHTQVELVAELGLDGAHVDSRADVSVARAALPPGALLGASRHEGDALEDDALDYVTLSPIFAPLSKQDTRAPLGVGVLNGRNIVALGGIDETRAPACFRAGASAVAVIGAVMGAHDPRRALLALQG